jgi:hypothetical protein
MNQITTIKEKSISLLNDIILNNNDGFFFKENHNKLLHICRHIEPYGISIFRYKKNIYLDKQTSMILKVQSPPTFSAKIKISRVFKKNKNPNDLLSKLKISFTTTPPTLQTPPTTTLQTPPTTTLQTPPQTLDDLFSDYQTPTFENIFEFSDLFSSPQPSLFSSPQPSLFSSPQPSLFSSPQPSLFSSPQPSLFSSPQSSLFSSPQSSLFSSPQPSLFSSPQSSLFSSPQSSLFSSFF